MLWKMCRAATDLLWRFLKIAEIRTEGADEKVNKADSEITKQKKAFDQRLGLPQGDDEGVASLADKMKKRWQNFRPSS